LAQAALCRVSFAVLKMLNEKPGSCFVCGAVFVQLIVSIQLQAHNEAVGHDSSIGRLEAFRLFPDPKSVRESRYRAQSPEN